MVTIPKYPRIDEDFTTEQIEQLTNIVFGKKDELLHNQKFDCIFVFGGSHPGIWKTTLEAYRKRLSNRVILTGGVKPNVIRHSSWDQGNRSEASVIKEQLVKEGVPEEIILKEERSTNSLENILFARDLLDFNQIKSVLFVCKSFAIGRQFRTLRKNLPSHLEFSSYSFDTQLRSERLVTRDNWVEDEESCSFIYGEYLRIYHYGQKGDIEPLDSFI